jgi:hypothetical protein
MPTRALAEGHSRDVLVGERHVDNETCEPGLVENEQQPLQLVGTERYVAVHQLRTCVEIRPDSYAVETKAADQLKIFADGQGAHRAEVTDERQKPGRSVDGKAIALNGQLLRLRVASFAENGRTKRARARRQPWILVRTHSQGVRSRHPGDHPTNRSNLAG